MMAILTKGFARFARKAGIRDDRLLAAAADVAKGNFDADLGGGVFKQRVARERGGKSGGFRTIIVFRIGGRSFFVHGFAKSDKSNVAAKELDALKKLADVLLGLSEEEIEEAVRAGEFMRIEEDDHDEAETR
jgi:hypothetical protein